MMLTGLSLNTKLFGVNSYLVQDVFQILMFCSIQ